MTTDPRFVRVPSADPQTEVWWSEDGRVVLRRFRRHNIRAAVDGIVLEGSWATVTQATFAVSDHLIEEGTRRALAGAVGRTVASVERRDENSLVRVTFLDGAVLTLRAEECSCPDWYDEDKSPIWAELST